MLQIEIRPIHPARMRLDSFSTTILKALKEESNTHWRMIGKVSKTWSQENKPKMVQDFFRKGGDIGYVVHTDSVPFVWLHEGTPIRWALMKPGFRPKTTPRVLGSKAGPPSRIFVELKGRRAFQRAGRGPRPGIKAREWFPEIQRRREKPFNSRMARAMSVAANNLFRGTGVVFNPSQFL